MELLAAMLLFVPLYNISCEMLLIRQALELRNERNKKKKEDKGGC